MDECFTCATPFHVTMQILLQFAVLSTVQQLARFCGSRVDERQIRASLCPSLKFVNLTKTTNARQTIQLDTDIICVLCY